MPGRCEVSADDLLMMAAEIAEAHRDQSEIDDASIETLSGLIASWLRLVDDIEERETHLKELKKKAEIMKMADIPAMMKSLGLVSSDDKGKFTMADGTKIYLRSDVFVSVYAQDADQARAWLRNSGNSHCIKEEFSTSRLKEVIKGLRLKGVDPDAVILTADGERPLFRQYPVVYAVAQNRPLKGVAGEE